jgi:hypothetical protein
MCRYYYGEGRCANVNISEGICSSQENCGLFSMAKNPKENECDTESWYGLYCAKYKRFFCPGKDSCQTYDEYSKSFQNHLRPKDSQ